MKSEGESLNAESEKSYILRDGLFLLLSPQPLKMEQESVDEKRYSIR